MFDFTMQMNAIALLLDDISLKMDTIFVSEHQFNPGLFKFHFFVATNGGTEGIRSKADKDLKA
jgi:hypothetical protein